MCQLCGSLRWAVTWDSRMAEAASAMGRPQLWSALSQAVPQRNPEIVGVGPVQRTSDRRGETIGDGAAPTTWPPPTWCLGAISDSGALVVGGVPLLATLVVIASAIQGHQPARNHPSRLAPAPVAT